MMQQAISINLIAYHHFYYLYYSKKESGTEIGNSLEFDFVVKADEISVVEPTQPLRLARQSKKIERLGLLSQPLDINSLLDKEVRT